MTRWWDDLAARLQQAQLERDATPDRTYSDAEIRQAIAFTRSDLVLVVAHLSSLNRQLATVIKLLIVLLFVAIGIFARLAAGGNS